MEIAQERLEREFGLDLIVTAPTVAYQVRTTDGRLIMVDNPALLPRRERHRGDRGAIHPGVDPYAGGVPRRGDAAVRGSTRGAARPASISRTHRVILHYELPLAEIVFDFYDRLKSVSAVMPRWIMSFWTSARSIWLNWTSASTGRRSTRYPLSCIGTRPTIGGGRLCEKMRAVDSAPDVRDRDPGRQSGPRLSHVRASRRCARTSPRNATAAISRASASCSRSRRKVRDG